MPALGTSLHCHYCSRWLPSFRVHAFGSDSKPTQTICEDCLDWHMRAIALLAGEGIPPGCQICGITKEKLCAAVPGVEWRLYVVPRDGLYSVLCAACVHAYVTKRRDLYRDTAFGARLKL